MANLCAAVTTVRPIVTGVVFVVRPIGGSVHLGAGQHVVLVHVMIPALHVVALLVEGRTLKDVRADVQIVEVNGDKLTTGIVPGTGADPVPREDTTLVRLLGAEIGPPFPVTRTRCLCERLASGWSG